MFSKVVPVKDRPPSARPTHRVNVENEMIKKREKEMKHQIKWAGAVEYYKKFEKTNNKYEEWTSPRYYDESTKLWNQVKEQRDKEKALEERREALQKLFREEEASYQIELMVKNRDKYLSPREKPDDIPTEVLNDVNLGIKIAEEDRRRHEAELKLYHQWRNNNPTIRHHERLRNLKDTKLSWLDQQIKKRMETEKSEAECKRMLAERDKQLVEQKKKEEQFQKEVKEKNERLQRELEEQIRALEMKQNESYELKKIEDEELCKRLKFLELEEVRRENEQKKKDLEVALYNIKQHKTKLKKKAQNIQDNLRADRDLIENIIKLDIIEQMQNEHKKLEIKEAILEFLKFMKEQQELEAKREKHFAFLFDSESKALYERQNEIWDMEQHARKQLLEDMMNAIREQIEDNVKRNHEKQQETLQQREAMLKSLEKCNEEIERLQMEETNKKIEFRKNIDAQIRDRSRKKKELDSYEQRNIDKEIEDIRKEEQRLKNEIMMLQMKQGPSHRRMKTRFY